MLKKKTVIIWSIVLVLLVGSVSSFLTLYLTGYDFNNDGRVVINKQQLYELEEVQKLEAVKEIVGQNYITTVDNNKLMDGAVKGLVASLGDPYSVYYTPDEFKQLQETTTGTYAGVGLLVSVNTKNNRITVVHAFKNSPGAKAGIISGDEIVKVNSTALDGSMLDKAVSMMKGAKGTKVNVTIVRNGVSKAYDLYRDNVIVETVSNRMLQNNIGYIVISNFEQNTAKEFSDALSNLKKQKMKGLIIDIRDNPGGLLDVVTKIADQLLPKGKIVYTEDRYGHKDVINSDANALNLPLVLLVNGNSASASEILAGSVQDYGVGKLIGTKTFGKGIVQSIESFKDGSGLKLTTSRYFTPKGRCIHKIGITPDVVIDLPQDLKKDPTKLNDNNDVQLKKGIEVINSMIK